MKSLKHFLLLAFSGFFLTGMAIAQDSLITIGSGNQTSDKYPFNAGSSFSWADGIYLRSEIGVAGQITSIWLSVANNPVNFLMEDQRIFMRHTSDTRSPNTYPSTSGYELVFQGPIGYNGGGWKEIVLNVPFNYNNVQNLEILFENHDGSGSSGGPVFRYTASDSSGLRTVFGQEFFPVPCPDPALSVCGSVKHIINIGLTFGGSPLISGLAVCPDDNKNWMGTTLYDGSGMKIAESRIFSDYFGREIQVQSRVISANNVLAVQSLSDAYGRPVLQSLPAPIFTPNDKPLCYKDFFIMNQSGANYTYNDFDVPNHTSNPAVVSSGEVDNPRPLNNTSVGSAGWYYGNNNLTEPYVPATGFPYTRVEYDNHNQGAIKRSTLAGDFHRMGQGREMQQYTIPASGELYYIYGYARGWNIQNAIEQDPSGNWFHFKTNFLNYYQVRKTITIDPNGNESVSFFDLEGKHLMECLSGPIPGASSQKSYKVRSVIDGNTPYNYVDIHLPPGCEGTLTLDNADASGEYSILNLKTGEYVSFGGSTTFVGDRPNLSPGIYRIILVTAANGRMIRNIRYEVNYHNFTVNYYDLAGNLKVQIPPLGIDNSYDPDPQISHSSHIGELNVMSDGSSWTIDETDSFNEHIDLYHPPAGPGSRHFTNFEVLLYHPSLPRPNPDYVSEYLSDRLGSLPSGIPDTGDVSAFLKPDLPGDNAVYEISLSFDVIDSSGNPLFGYENYFIMIKYIKGATTRWEQAFTEQFTVDPEITATLGPLRLRFHDLAVWDGTQYKDIGTAEVQSWYDELQILVNGETHSLSAAPSPSMGTVYSYNSLGWLLSAESPDEGLTEYVYKNDGSLRFSQNSRQRQENPVAQDRRFLYTNYDGLGRISDFGEYDPQLSSAATNTFFENESQYLTHGPGSSSTQYSVFDVLHNNNLDPARCRERTFVGYDTPDPSFASLTGLASSGYTQEFLTERISKTSNSVSATWYSYDEQGRLKWTVQRIEGMQEGSSAYSIKTVDYEYDFNGNIVQVSYQKEKPSEAFYHYYEYDADKRLKRVLTSRDGVSRTEQAGYSYYLHGPVKRVVLANGLQGLDYVYTINGWLKSLNSPQLDNTDPGRDGNPYSTGAVKTPRDLFGLSLDYFAGDYMRSGSGVQSYPNIVYNPSPAQSNNTDLYNGLIKGMRWRSAGPGISGLRYPNSQLVYAYRYDHKYQLSGAVFGAVSHPGMTFGQDYRVDNLSYDLNGNILSLRRNGYNGSPDGLLMDNLSYTYITGTNRLKQVAESAGGSPYGSYGFSQPSGSPELSYDPMGSLKTDPYRELAYAYNIFNRLKSAHHTEEGTLRMAIAYDDRGYRLKKSEYTGVITPVLARETWYVNDGSGNVLSVYENDHSGSLGLVQKELNVFGSGRLGAYDPAAGNYTWEIGDHLGNVRSTFICTRDLSLSTGYSGTGPDDYLFTLRNIDRTRDRNLLAESMASAITHYPDKRFGPSLLLDVKAGEVLDLSVYYSYIAPVAIPPRNADAGLVILFSSGGPAAATVVPVGPSTPGGWVLLTHSYTVPADGSVYIYPQNNDTAPGGVNVWFDDFSITITPNAAGEGGVYKPQLTGISDYYPHGGLMPGRVYSALSYRYDYQGQFAEKDELTGLNSFEARMYDAKLGRWHSADPASQFHSPYNGMGNNPVSGQDSDGRLVIFVNGFHPVGMYKPNSIAAIKYWSGLNNKFMDRIGDQKAEYLDGSSGPFSSAVERFGLGYKYGNDNIKYFQSRLQPGESVKIVAHSQGVAYSMGLAGALMSNGINVEIAYGLGTKQGEDVMVPRGLEVRQFHSSLDLIAPYSRIPASTRINFTSRDQLIKNIISKGLLMGPHSISGYKWIFNLSVSRGVRPARYKLRF